MFGSKIRKLREKSDLSQDKLAHLAKVSGDYLSKIELGKVENVGIKTLERIAHALGVTLRDLITHKAA